MNWLFVSIYISVSFLISWTPYAIVSLVEAFWDVNLIKVSPMLVLLPCLMAKSACIWNPLVYVCHNSQFRSAFLQKFGLSKKFRISFRGSSDSKTRESDRLNNVSLQTYQSKVLSTGKDPAMAKDSAKWGQHALSGVEKWKRFSISNSVSI